MAATALIATALLPMTPAQAAISAPADLRATAATKGAVDLAWTAPAEGETGYSIQRGTEANALQEIATVDTPTVTYEDRGLVPGVRYYYAVLALAGGSASAPQDPPLAVDVASDALLYTIDEVGSSQTLLVSSPIVSGVESATYVTLARSDKPIWGLSVSPDGSQVAYAQDDSATNTNLYVRKADGSDAPVQLTSAAGLEVQPTWSPNSATILFTQFTDDEDFEGDLRTVPAAGGSIASLPANGGANHEYGSYTPDGASIVAVNDAVWSDTGDSVLSKISVSSGARSTISGSTGIYAPTVSPDGTRIAGECYDPFASSGLAGAICTLPVGGGSKVKVSSLGAGGSIDYAEDYAPEWSSDGARIHFSRYVESGVFAGQSLGRVLATGSGQVVTPWSSDVYLDYPQVSSTDTTAPITSVTAPTSSSTLASTVVVNWGGFDPGGSGIATYDVRQSRYTYAGVRTDTALLTATTLRTKTVSVGKGNVYCFSVRAKDKAGNTATAYSSARCITVPLDQTSFSRSSGWFTGTGSYYYGGSIVSIAKKSATLTRTGVKAKQIGVVVRTCSTCGSVYVYVGSTKVGTISTKASATVYKKLIWLPAFSSVRSGTLKFVTTSTAKVYIDGVAVKSI